MPLDPTKVKLDRLNEAERKNPVLVLTSFYESFDMDDVRTHLKEALNLIIEKRFRYREYSMEEDNVRFFFEKMEKVMEAAWVMKE